MRASAIQRAFTLVEIMIVILIIGILMAIAVPNYLAARANSQRSTCLANLREIEGAKEQWAMVTGADSSAEPTESDLVGSATTGYLKAYPECPAGGEYTIGDMNTRPDCDIAGHTLD